MKTLSVILTVVVAVVVGGAAYLYGAKRGAARHALELAQERSSWQGEVNLLRGELEAQLRRASPVSLPSSAAPVSVEVIRSAATPAEILAALQALRVTPGPGLTQTQRRVVQLLRNLADTGEAAVPVIGDFLSRNEDVLFLAGGQGGGKGEPPGKEDALVPASLRLGLFQVLHEIGGPEAEQLLGTTLRWTGRGLEVLVLTRILEEQSPGQHREVALASARELLARPPLVAEPNPLDERSSDSLLEVLGLFRDASLAGQLTTRLVRSDGQVDGTVVRMLRRTLEPDSLPAILQALQDPRVTDPKQKEPLMELALGFVGFSAQANGLLHEIVTHPDWPVKTRERAIKDLDALGLQNDKTPTAIDRQLLEARVQILEDLKPSVQDAKLLETLTKTQEKLRRLAQPRA